jgi:DNA-binding NarL/FixJ family response regulator
MERVFIFSNRSLFTQGVDSLLEREPGLEVVGWETDPDEAIRRIRKVQPDVVILASEDATLWPSADAIRLLREGLGTKIKIIGLNLQDNTLCIYHGEQREVKEVGDLVRAIEQLPAV